MSFIYSNYSFLAILGIIAFALTYIVYTRRYFKWVHEYWFYKRSKANYISGFFYVLSISLAIVSLLDARGPEEKIKANIPDQKTIILVDASASMLVEDIRPNRFQKALMLARHFVKKSAGHQMAIVLFSDTQKRIVPFTDDIDFLDAKIAGLKDIDIQKGGSSITQALHESIQYFKEGSSKELSGNILLLTDSEENEEWTSLKIPDEINVAVIGVGTRQGGPIPLRSNDGRFRGYKEHEGEKVISKLNEDYIRKLGTKIKNFKYWIALSYSIPTEEILSFFRGIHKAKYSKGDVRIRPVYAKYLIIPFILSFVVSVIFRVRNSFTLSLVLMFLVFSAPPKLLADDEIQDQTLVKQLEKFKTGEMLRGEVLLLAENLLRSGKEKEAVTLYEEYLREDQEDDEETLFNYGTALLKTGNVVKGSNVLKKVIERVGESEDKKMAEFLDSARNNILLALNSDQKGKQNKKENKDNKKEDEQQSGSSQSKSDDNEKGQNKKENKKDKDKKSQNDQDKKEKDKEKEKNEDKEQDKKDSSGKEKQETLEEKEKRIKQERKMVKIPAMLKQIMDDDKDLQRDQIIKETRKERWNPGKKKDW